MTPVTDMHSVWLMPEAEDQATLSAIVAELATAFEAPLFRPHLTLVEDRPSDALALARQVGDIVQGIGPFSADIEGIGTSDLFFRAFYARFAAVGPVLELKQRAIHSIATSPIGSFMPHISLAYGVADTPLRRRVSSEMDKRLAGQSIRFGRIAIVRSAQSIPIEAWEVRATVPLA